MNEGDGTEGTLGRLGRYRLVRIIARGGMGIVYEALDTRLNRTVAVKTVLRSHLADEDTAGDYAARFEREAQAAARLQHPNVVAVFDFGEHEDVSYIVMEYVAGRELNQLFAAGERLALPQAVRIVRELLGALDYAHRLGVVHRDVKPANVMLDGAGHVKLTDFGVARVVNANQDRTMPGTQVGTPSYMAPEQVLGLAVGSRTDIFAAGVVLYQCLTGQRPFSGGGPFDVQRKIVQDEPVPASQLDASVPPAFDAVLARALAKRPEDRYQTAAAFADDLERSAAGAPERLDLTLPAAPAPAADAGADPDATRVRPPAAVPAGASAVGAPRRRGWSFGALVAVVVAVLVALGWLARPRTAPSAPAQASAPAVVAAPPAASMPASQPAAALTPSPPIVAASVAAPRASAAVARQPPRHTAVAPPPAAPRAPVPSRCSDLLERMQLGEPLSAEQNAYFQSRCTR